MREHTPITIDKFNGLWDRGDIEETPLDHFSDCNNIQFPSGATFGTRDGVGLHQTLGAPLSGILRMYNYPTQDRNTILVLTTGGTIYHVIDSATMFGPILTIPAMTDFGFVPYAGRAYITPFSSTVVGGLARETGLAGDFLYVYKGDGSPARKAGGTTPTTAITVVNGAAGVTDTGVHIFGYVYETDTGYQTPPGGLTAFTMDGLHELDFSTIANSPDAFVTVKRLVASKAITSYNGDVNGYQLFFIPGATIPNNIVTTLSSIQFFDADLLDDASHLSDNFSSISAGVGLCVYHNRLCLWGENANISLIRVSNSGEPEAINQINGLCLVPPDGNPLTNASELRDVLYAFKRNKTVSFTDNGDVPTSWPMSVIDNAMGCGVHGLATTLDSGSSNIDYLIVGSYKGMTLFNGTYMLPELSWKIQQRWLAQDFKLNFRKIQIVNDSVNQLIYIVTTDNNLLHANYANGFDPKGIRWTPWTFPMKVNTLCLVNVSELLLGCDQV